MTIEYQNRQPVPGMVSIIVPCYNVEKYLEKFVDSIVLQTYKNLEIVLVNDGSNRETTELLRAAVPIFRDQGYIVKLIEQENKGLGGAVDTGLKYFTGEFLLWPDPDDWLMPHAIESRVNIMKQNPDVGLLRSNAALFDEARQEFQGHFMEINAQPRRAPDLFDDLLFMRCFFAPVCHMVRSKMFLQVHPERSIFFSPASSQNFQLLVPLVELFPVLEMAGEVSAVYRVREDSRSRASNGSGAKLMARFDQLMELTEATLPKLRTATPERLDRIRNFHWRNRMLPTAIRAGMKDRCFELVARSALKNWQRSLARVVISLRCNKVFCALDIRTGRVASRVVARYFDRLVRLPRAEMCWGAEPLWT